MPYYLIKEIYYTIQGEGQNIGRPAVFCRFSKCNLWSGKEVDRDKAICKFCDTDFLGVNGENGGEYKNAEDLAQKIDKLWPNTSNKFVVFTGGEPLLQLDLALISSIKKHNFEIAVETNGTISAPEGIDWLTVSPKLGSKLVQKSGSELKVVIPQDFNLKEFENLDFKHFLLSPMITDSESINKRNIQIALDYCLKNPQWKMTYQCHKIWNIR